MGLSKISPCRKDLNKIAVRRRMRAKVGKNRCFKGDKCVYKGKFKLKNVSD